MIDKSCQFCLISGFIREVHEICALLGYYAAYYGMSLPAFRDMLWVPFSRVKNPSLLILEDGTYRLYRNVGKELPPYAA